jgi:hypothetical protein
MLEYGLMVLCQLAPGLALVAGTEKVVGRRDVVVAQAQTLAP